VSVDTNDVNRAWAEKMGITYPLLSDRRRQLTKAYGVLHDDPAMLEDLRQMGRYLRAKRTWIVIDKQGVIRYVKIIKMEDWHPPIDEMLKVLSELQ